MTKRQWALAILFIVLGYGFIDLGLPALGAAIFCAVGYNLGLKRAFEVEL